MDIGEVLGKAWQITWKNKGLWVLGILAACGSGAGGGGGGSGGSNARGNWPTNGDAGEILDPIRRFLENIPPEAIAAIVVGFFLLVLALALLFMVLGTLGQGGLIAGFDLADAGAERVTLAQAFNAGLPHFWRLLGLRLLMILLAIVVGFTIAVPLLLFIALSFGVGLVLLLPLFCLLLPILLVFSIALRAYLMLTQTAIVVENLGVFDALRRAWNVVRASPGPSALMAVILAFGYWLVGLVIAVPLILSMTPLLFGLLATGGDLKLPIILLTALCVVAYIPVMVVLQGVLQTFVTGSWTLTFRRLRSTAPPPPLAAEAAA